MADFSNPGATSQGPNRGAAFVLDTNLGLKPLGILMNQEAQRKAEEKAAADKKQKTLEASNKFLSDPGEASLQYKTKAAGWYNQFVTGLTDLQQKYQRGEIDATTLNNEAERQKYALKSRVDATNKLEDARKQLEVAAKDKIYNTDKIREGAQQILLNENGELHDNPTDTNYQEKAQKLLNDPNNWNKGEILKGFFDNLQQQAYSKQIENGDLTEEVILKNKLPLVLVEDDMKIKRPVKDPAGHYRIDMQKALPLVKTDPYLSRMIDQEYATMRDAYQTSGGNGSEPTYEQAIEKTFADNNPVDYTYRESRDEPRPASQEDKDKQEMLSRATPVPATRESNVRLAEIKGQEFTGNSRETKPFKSFGLTINTIKGKQVLPYADIPGIPAKTVVYADGSKPDLKDTRLIDVRGYHVGEGLVSGSGKPLLGGTLEDQLNYIKTRLNTRDDFDKIKLGRWVEGEISNKVNKVGDTAESMDQNRIPAAEAKYSGQRLDSEKRVFIPWNETIARSLKSSNSTADYDRLGHTPEYAQLERALAERYNEVMANKKSSAPKPSTARTPLKKGSLDNL